MGEVDYYQHIHSPKWHDLSGRLKDERGRKCQVCGRTEDELDVPLDAHHNTYDRLGDELDTDIVILCRECHELFHKGEGPGSLRVGYSCYEDRRLSDVGDIAAVLERLDRLFSVKHLHHYKGDLLVFCARLPHPNVREIIGRMWQWAAGASVVYRYAPAGVSECDLDDLSCFPVLGRLEMWEYAGVTHR